MLVQDGTLPGKEQWRWDAAGNSLEDSAEKVTHNSLTQVSFRYDPLGHRISKMRRQMLDGQPTGKPVSTRFVWEGFRLLQEVHGDVPLTCVYSDQDS
ncbi:hypothetical protein [Enterobacter sp. WPR_3_1]|uniref:hypothetical protein n=1 Tax=Enterobacter sp. WPR_3_1 TaxID=1907355 RepID=UPI0036D3E60D